MIGVYVKTVCHNMTAFANHKIRCVTAVADLVADGATMIVSSGKALLQFWLSITQFIHTPQAMQVCNPWLPNTFTWCSVS